MSFYFIIRGKYDAIHDFQYADINWFQSHTRKKLSFLLSHIYVIIEKPRFKSNKNDNIHKSEALQWKDKQTLTLVVCQN